MNAEDMIAFEKDIAADFEAGLIPFPVHLAGGNEQELIRVFKDVGPDDWICCQWRSHYHCLLKGVPSDQVRRAIHEGRSIALTFPEYKVISSAIVGGIAPIALGLAWAIKRRGGAEKVWVFIGDMTAQTGIVHEVSRYANGHELPLWFIVEDNGKSVCTNTLEAWGACAGKKHGLAMAYSYELTFPHVGTGRWVRF